MPGASIGTFVTVRGRAPWPGSTVVHPEVGFFGFTIDTALDQLGYQVSERIAVQRCRVDTGERVLISTGSQTAGSSTAADSAALETSAPGESSTDA